MRTVFAVALLGVTLGYAPIAGAGPLFPPSLLPSLPIDISESATGKTTVDFSFILTVPGASSLTLKSLDPSIFTLPGQSSLVDVSLSFLSDSCSGKTCIIDYAATAPEDSDPTKTLLGLNFIDLSLEYKNKEGRYNFISTGLLPELITVTDKAGDPSPTPLPTTWSMMLIGLAGFGFLGYRHNKRAELPATA